MCNNVDKPFVRQCSAQELLSHDAVLLSEGTSVTLLEKRLLLGPILCMDTPIVLPGPGPVRKSSRQARETGAAAAAVDSPPLRIADPFPPEAHLHQPSKRVINQTQKDLLAIRSNCDDAVKTLASKRDELYKLQEEKFLWREILVR